MVQAIVIAGGVGARMGAGIPKQFVEVKGKPVLAYTLEGIQRNENIDRILVVCVQGYEDVVRAYPEKWGITKLDRVITGGNSAQDSIRLGVNALEDSLSPEDIVVIHDGIRPLVDEYVLTDVIQKARQYGNGVTSMPYNEQIFVIDNELSTIKYIPRETLRRVATPQAYRYDLLRDAYKEAFEKGIGVHGSAYTNTMMVELGHRLYFAAGSDRNIKLTTPGELEIFAAMLPKN